MKGPSREDAKCTVGGFVEDVRTWTRTLTFQDAAHVPDTVGARTRYSQRRWDHSENVPTGPSRPGGSCHLVRQEGLSTARWDGDRHGRLACTQGGTWSGVRDLKVSTHFGEQQKFPALDSTESILTFLG